jgi:tRNA (guanine-N7-)-methyltransferase
MPEDREGEFPRGIRSYVLRGGRMSEAQRRSYEGLSAAYCLPFAPEPLDIRGIFGNRGPLAVEIGFGMGIATAELAEARRDTNFLGFEVHRPGIGRLLWEIERRGLGNLRIMEHDAAEGIEKALAPGSVSAFHLFFPDPWPKKRHHKRRLVSRPFTGLLAERLAPGGYIYMVTDWEDYAHWARGELSAVPALENPYGGFPGGFSPPQPWRPRTKFEEKALAAGREIRELFFTKRFGEGTGE